ncbi:MAG: AAA family ATPase [Candidatus Thiodiazotropha sp. (ex Ctena orbiculata)]|uniref:AAA family ATPase n=1 Tax=Candidatus Thiodiazotropha taylori TaxID=2792791 RepID=A0A944M7G5_9GAMM|nr:AAA family ATPase [Candidatus Thiodiazotropha taylori]
MNWWDRAEYVEIVLNISEIIDSEFEVKFFERGDSFSQRYRVTNRSGAPYHLTLYNSAKLPRHSFAGGKLLEVLILEDLAESGLMSLVGYGELERNAKKYHFVITNYISGEPLQEKLEREGTLTQYAAIPLGARILNSLSKMHGHPKVIVHNNICPASIFLDYSDSSEKPILFNFNMARYMSNSSGSIDLSRLSPFYVAPELYNGVFTPQSDIFAVGALLYRVVMGIPPWHVEMPMVERNSDKYIDAILKKRDEPLTFSVGGFDEATDDHFRGVVSKALSLDVDNRFHEVGEFIDALTSEVVMELSTKLPAQSRKATPRQGEGFSAISGMQELKEILTTDVIRALEEKDLYESYGITIPNGMLLYGPPGCGKTFIAERFAEEVGFNFLQLKPSDLKSKYVNETEEKIGTIFKEAAEKAPTTIFIDEIDAIVPNRERDLHHMHASAVNEILVQMSSCSERGIFVIAASNRPDMIDPAVLRTGRVDRIIYLPPPDREARKAMFEMYLSSRPVDLGVNYDELANLTENYVSSDIKFLIDEASRQALKGKERITQAILTSVISASQPSVSLVELEKYQALRARFEDKKSGTPKKRPIGFVHYEE